VVTEGLLGEVVEPPGLNVSFELPIPHAQSYSRNQARNSASSAGDSACTSSPIFSTLLMIRQPVPHSNIRSGVKPDASPAG
jgi:hypothetical protein